MSLLRLRRPITLSPHFLSKLCSFCSKASTVVDKANCIATQPSVDKRQAAPENYSSKLHLSPLFSDGRPHSHGYDIELVDNDTWQVSSGLAHAWRGLELDRETEAKSAFEPSDEQADGVTSFQGDPDFDEIDNMRIRGNLFYRLDRNSKEFEECSFEFYRKKSPKRKDYPPEEKEKKESLKKNDNKDGSRKKENPGHNLALKVESLPQIVKNGTVYSLLDSMNGPGGLEQKKVRIPTFNQLTAPYHEPFCLDIYISKASVRACVIHRVTSKVVAVAHSISKDMKFDLVSTRNAAACAAVGKILAQRALADDIHNVIYTPRKGDRLEGKLQIVLQAMIDNGVNVKVKLKQRKPKKRGPQSSA